MRRLLIAFFLSGFAALVYQVVWQRSLFAIFGIHSEAVTVVVTAFMLGLGLGSLLGGALSRDPRRPALLWFAGVETGIGLFGAVSLPLYTAVGHATASLPAPLVALVTFALVLLPTLLMGSTLPLLTTHLVRRWNNVGSSVAALYWVNTLGSAVAAVATAFVLLSRLGQQRTVLVAVAINLAVAAGALALHLGERKPA